jgi:hypothetical protein
MLLHLCLQFFGLGFVDQPKEPSGFLVKPTCLLHTWRLTGNNLSRLFFTCTNTSQAATCICNT